MIALRACAGLQAIVLCLLPATIAAQTLPQSTIDRQTIAQLQYQLSLPGVTATQRRESEIQISQLEYQINTRPPIEPPPASQMPLLKMQSSPFPSAEVQFPVQVVPATVYGSCDAGRSLIAYLSGEMNDAQLTAQERAYIPQHIVTLRNTLRSQRCNS
ncbi:MAG: hypothetical protein ABI282_03130 [Candidatus Baltobacteraceae bacterium]